MTTSNIYIHFCFCYVNTRCKDKEEDNLGSEPFSFLCPCKNCILLILRVIYPQLTSILYCKFLWLGTSNLKWSRFLATKIVKLFHYTFKGFPSADFKLTTFCCITAVESNSNIKVRPPSKSLF